MISAVIPVLNEEESLQILEKRLIPELQKIDKQYEIIFVDDGSTDASLIVLKELRKKNLHIRIFSFRRNQGKAEALTVGFQMAKGDTIVTLDADLQDRPEEIGKLYERLKQGYDVVGGWRQERKHSLALKIASKTFNTLLGTFWGTRLHDYNCGLKVFTNDAAKSLHLYGGMHRFVPLLASEQGFRVTEVAVIHDVRKYGKAKYGISKLWKDLPDMFTMLFLTKYGKRPLHFFASVGSLIFFIGLGIFLYLWIVIEIIMHQAVGRRPILFVSLSMMLAGLQIVFTGFLADLMTHLFHQSQVHREETLQKHLLKYSTE